MADPKKNNSIKNQILIQEYVELKRLNSENSTLTQKNDYLISEISLLEVKLSELDAKLNAREAELQRFSGRFPNDIDTQIKILELENSKLKDSSRLQQKEI